MFDEFELLKDNSQANRKQSRCKYYGNGVCDIPWSLVSIKKKVMDVRYANYLFNKKQILVNNEKSKRAALAKKELKDIKKISLESAMNPMGHVGGFRLRTQEEKEDDNRSVHSIFEARGFEFNVNDNDNANVKNMQGYHATFSDTADSEIISMHGSQGDNDSQASDSDSDEDYDNEYPDNKDDSKDVNKDVIKELDIDGNPIQAQEEEKQIQTTGVSKVGKSDDNDESQKKSDTL